MGSPIKQGDGPPHSICRPCKKSLVTIQEADEKQISESMAAVSQRAVRKKRLVKTRVEKRGERDHVYSKVPLDGP